MPALSTRGLQRTRKLFHNEHVDVYPTTVHFNQIHFWPENNRTVFTLERLERERGKHLRNIDLDTVTQFIADQDIHKLQALADNIERNGVQVPLIICDDGRLLDGNRRYFACSLLRMQHQEQGKPEPQALSDIPAQIIRAGDLKGTLELKILAEANFVQDLKVPWPLDAQARAVEQYYRQILKQKGSDEDTALAEVSNVFGITRQRAKDLLDTLVLTQEFIRGTADEQMRRRAIVEDKFVYFWEFRNKATRGRGALDGRELLDVKEMFFGFMARGKDNPIRNVKWVEPLVQSRTDSPAWRLVRESRGAKLGAVVSLMSEKKEVRKAEDKIRLFIAWLKGVSDLPGPAKTRLKELAELAREKYRE